MREQDRTDVEHLKRVRVDDAVEVEGMGVEVFVRPESGIHERLLETTGRTKSLVVADAPAVCYDALGGDA